MKHLVLVSSPSIKGEFNRFWGVCGWKSEAEGSRFWCVIYCQKFCANIVKIARGLSVSCEVRSLLDRVSGG